MRMRSSAVLVTAILVAAPCRGDVLCKSRKGAVSARAACRRKETPLDLAAFGALGPRGPQGPPGDPGSALAYAHVTSSGLLVAADSHAVTAASAAVGNPGATCLSVAATTLHVAAVTLDIDESGGPAGRAIFVALRPADVAAFVGSGACPAGTNAVVYTVAGSTPIYEEFYVTFN